MFFFFFVKEKVIVVSFKICKEIDKIREVK